MRVIKSGGVMMAATIIITMNECLRYSDNMAEVTTPIFPRKNAITGNWNTTAITSVSDTKVDTYESSVMLLTTFADTL